MAPFELNWLQGQKLVTLYFTATHQVGSRFAITVNMAIGSHKTIVDILFRNSGNTSV